jgi:hypothetical protein
MKTFKAVKRLNVIRAQCREHGVTLDDYNYRTPSIGSDHVALGMQGGERPDGSPLVHTAPGYPGGWVLFSVWNGRFFGRTPEGVEFDSGDAKFDDEPWFEALLDFFYVREGQ